HYVYLLTTDSGEQYSVHFAKEMPDVLSGARVKAKGLVLYGIKAKDAGETAGAMAVDDGNGGLVLLAAPGGKNSGSGGSTTTTTSLPNTLGAQQTLVILVNFYDNATQPYTPATAQNVIFDTVSKFYLEASYQQTSVTGDVKGWFTINSSATVCDTATIASEAKNAASKVVNLSSYSHLVYAFPKNLNCKWGGLSTVGGSPSQSWINGTFGAPVVAHELSHGMGLWHSHSLDCGAVTLGSNCKVVEYGDVVDTMGGGLSSASPHFNAFQKERLGWLNANNSPDILTVTTDGTYNLEAYESMGTGPKALKILKSTDPNTGKRTWYYIESRQPIGFDAFLSTDWYVSSYTNVPDGVLLHTGTESNGNSSNMLNLRPDTATMWDPALVTGESFNDTDAGVTMTTEWVTGTGAAVSVFFGKGGGGSGGSTSTTQPTVTVSTDQSSYNVNQTVTATALVTADGVPVANASVAFIFTKSNGAVVTGTATTGSNGMASKALRLKKQDPLGTYRVSTDATKDGMSGSAGTTFTVQ
ncbi:MAG: NEW3 domain-containing protein, partial [Gammaproteobacteria bacterium]